MTDIKVSQEAREAAADWAKLNGRTHQAANIRRGSCDSAPIVQAFARFEAQIVERCAKVAEDIMDADGVSQYKSHGVNGQWVARKAATAIRTGGQS